MLIITSNISTESCHLMLTFRGLEEIFSLPTWQTENSGKEENYSFYQNGFLNKLAAEVQKRLSLDIAQQTVAS